MPNSHVVTPASEPGPHKKLLALITSLSTAAHGDPNAQDLTEASAAANSGNYVLAFNALAKYYQKSDVRPS
jgi:hypothetical protein